jgi:hypothetical protein
MRQLPLGDSPVTKRCCAGYPSCIETGWCTPPMTESSRSRSEQAIASDAIDLFLEYRDKHGHDEPSAKAAAMNEFADAEGFIPSETKESAALEAEVGRTPQGEVTTGAPVAAPFSSDKPHDVQVDGAESFEHTARMLPCPSCEEKDVDATYSLGANVDGSRYVNAGCMVCGMMGPDSHSARDAADRWNALPRRITPSHVAPVADDDEAKEAAFDALLPSYRNTNITPNHLKIGFDEGWAARSRFALSANGARWEPFDRNEAKRLIRANLANQINDPACAYLYEGEDGHYFVLKDAPPHPTESRTKETR